MHSKDIKDSILGIFSILLGLYLVFSKTIISGSSLMKNIHFLAKAETYIQCLGSLLILLGFIIFTRSLSLKKVNNNDPEKNLIIKKETVYTILILILYIFLFSKLGYFIATFILVPTLTGIYRCKEEKELALDNKTSLKKIILEIIIYSIIVTVGLYIIFTEFLGVALN